MTANEEMRAFLKYLLRHQQECTAENCADCQTADHVYEFTRTMLFSAVAYPQVAIPAGRRTAAGSCSIPTAADRSSSM